MLTPLYRCGKISSHTALAHEFPLQPLLSVFLPFSVASHPRHSTADAALGLDLALIFIPLLAYGLTVAKIRS